MKKKHHITAYAYDKKGNLIDKQFNSYIKTHPLFAYYAAMVGKPEKIYQHAEFALLIKHNPGSIYRMHVERIGKSGKPLLAKPCKICQRIIKDWGIKQVTWTGMK